MVAGFIHFICGIWGILRLSLVEWRVGRVNGDARDGFRKTARNDLFVSRIAR